MADWISTLPDPILCHILSFLPTKKSVATSVLSKRWEHLWRSVPTLDFEEYVPKSFDPLENSKANYLDFVQSVYAFIVSQDLHQPIQTFRLRCYFDFYDQANLRVWVNAALKRSVKHIDISLPIFHVGMYKPFIRLPSAILRHRTLVVLKLARLVVYNFPSDVNLPSLKILHLNYVDFKERRYLVQLLSACQILEDLETKNIFFPHYLDIYKLYIPWEAVGERGALSIKVNDKDTNPYVEDVISVFHNSTRIELSYFKYAKYWLEVAELLKHCPTLQILVINQSNPASFDGFDEGGDWLYPESVPECISLHLKTCFIKYYIGSNGEFRFIRYILQNARVLRRMTIWVHPDANLEEKLEMTQKLSMCTRLSPNCELLLI